MARGRARLPRAQRRAAVLVRRRSLDFHHQGSRGDGLLCLGRAQQGHEPAAAPRPGDDPRLLGVDRLGLGARLQGAAGHRPDAEPQLVRVLVGHDPGIGARRLETLGDGNPGFAVGRVLQLGAALAEVGLGRVPFKRDVLAARPVDRRLGLFPLEVGDFEGLTDIDAQAGIRRLARLGLGAPVGQRIADLREEVVEAVFRNADRAADGAGDPFPPGFKNTRLAGGLPGAAPVAGNPEGLEGDGFLGFDLDDELPDRDEQAVVRFFGGGLKQGGEQRGGGQHTEYPPSKTLGILSAVPAAYFSALAASSRVSLKVKIWDRPRRSKTSFTLGLGFMRMMLPSFSWAVPMAPMKTPAPAEEM